MSMFFGVVLGIFLCWYSNQKRGLETAANKPATPFPAKPVRPIIVATDKVPPVNNSPKPVAKKASKKATAKVNRASKKSKARPQQKDDLKKIGGIGPKIAEILNSGGVITYRQLSQKKPAELKDLLSQAGGRYRAADLSTWSKQAKFAEKGDWQAVKKVWSQAQTN